MKKLLAAGALVVGLMFAVDLRAADEPVPSVPDAAQSDTDTDTGKGEADTALTETETVAKGRSILEKDCARCHAIGMDDTSHHEEAPPFRVVVTRYPPENLAEALAEGIVSGHPDMPEFVFQPDQIEAILAYLGTLVPASDGKPRQDK